MSEAKNLLDLIWLQREDPERKIHFYHGHECLSSLSYGELWSFASLCAEYLEEQTKAAKILISLRTGPEFLGMFFGAIMAGRIPVPLVTAEHMGTRDFVHFHGNVAKDVGSAVLVCETPISGILGEQLPPLRFSKDLFGGILKYENPPKPDDICFLQYSSGSTSEPKGVILRHEQVLINLRQINAGFQLLESREDRLATWLPLYHDMGLIGGFLAPLMNGREVFLHSPRDFVKGPLAWLEFVALKKVSFLMGPDFMYKILARLAPQLKKTLDLSHVRICMTGSEPVQAETLRQFTQRFAVHGLKSNTIMPVYGMAEAVLGVTFSPFAQEYLSQIIDVLAYEKGEVQVVKSATGVSHPVRELVSCGRPLPGITLQIRSESGRMLPEDRVGQIWFSSPAQTTGYYGNEEATTELLHDGWLKTGDLGFLHEGNLYVSGREKDVIISRGKKIHAVDLEKEILEDFSVVRKVAAVALSGERAALAVELRPLFFSGRESLKQQIAMKISRHVAINNDMIFLVPARTLPLTSSGKLRRFHVKKMIENGELGRLAGYYSLYGVWAKAKNALFKLKFRESANWEADPLREEIAFIFSQVTNFPKDRFDWQRNLADFGLDSLQLMNLFSQLEKRLGAISLFEFYKLQNLEQVYQLCLRHQVANDLTRERANPPTEPRLH